jgi:hypothetical protein
MRKACQGEYLELRGDVRIMEKTAYERLRNLFCVDNTYIG